MLPSVNAVWPCSSSISGTLVAPLSVPSSVLLTTSTCRSPNPCGATSTSAVPLGKCAFMTIVPVPEMPCVATSVLKAPLGCAGGANASVPPSSLTSATRESPVTVQTPRSSNRTVWTAPSVRPAHVPPSASATRTLACSGEPSGCCASGAMSPNSCARSLMSRFRTDRGSISLIAVGWSDDRRAPLSRDTLLSPSTSNPAAPWPWTTLPSTVRCPLSSSAAAPSPVLSTSEPARTIALLRVTTRP
ncbi:Uncharacterised protein [Bordetella pertussis]|nr:Uncharacterised protein [Bordetella pertussis]